MSYSSSTEPSLVSYPLARTAYEYMMRLKDLGAFEGALGKMTPLPALLPIIDALHTVLSGGEVEIKIVHRGNPDVMRELGERMEQSQKDANEINEKSGYYVTLGAP